MGHKMGYKNATEILPEELIGEIRKHFYGGLLWVPATRSDNRERDEIILKLIKNDVPAKEIAALAKITPRHVRRIVQRHADAGTGVDTN